METSREPFEEEPEYKPSTHSANPPADTRLSVAANAIGYALNEDRANEAGVVHVSAADAALHRRVAERVVSQLDEYDRTQMSPEDAYVLRPGDVLIIRYPWAATITPEVAETIKRRTLEKLPGIRDVLVVCADQMEIYRDGAS